MVPPKLLAYLREKKKIGYPNEMLRAQFVNKGWSDAILDEAFALLDSEQSDSGSIEVQIQAANSISAQQAASGTQQPPSMPPVSPPPPGLSTPAQPMRPRRSFLVSTRMKIYMILGVIAAIIVFAISQMIPSGGTKPGAITEEQAIQSAIETSYEIAVEQAGFSAYKVTTLPEGFAVNTGYEVEEEDSGKTYIRIAISLKDDPQGTVSPIVIRQSAVDETFDESAINFGEGAEVTPVIMSSAKSGTGYISINSSEDSTLRWLYFVTPDNILVEIASPQATDDQINQVAQGLTH